MVWVMKTNTMTKTYTEKRPCIGGAIATYEITETNEWDGKILGNELTDAHQLRMADCDHYESDDEDGIEIARNRWVKKSLVKKVVWQYCPVTKTKTICRVEFARPL